MPKVMFKQYSIVSSQVATVKQKAVNLVVAARYLSGWVALGAIEDAFVVELLSRLRNGPLSQAALRGLFESSHFWVSQLRT